LFDGLDAFRKRHGPLELNSARQPRCR
jgi:hypothetical protein